MISEPVGQKDERQAYFDQEAAAWDLNEPDIQDTLRRLDSLEMLGLRAGLDVLDVGCGTGIVTQWLANRVRPGRIKAVDFSAGMIDAARAKGIEAEFAVADVCQDDLGEAKFDLVFCFRTFPHFPDKAAALRNMTRSLRPGGRLMILHLKSSQQVNAFHQNLGGAIGQDRLPCDHEWPALLEQAGLKQRQHIDQEGLFLLEASKS